MIERGGSPFPEYGRAWISTIPLRRALPCLTGSLPFHSIIQPVKGGRPVNTTLQGHARMGVFVPALRASLSVIKGKREEEPRDLCSHLDLGTANVSHHPVGIIGDLSLA
jgi:hypothetical protein